MNSDEWPVVNPDVYDVRDEDVYELDYLHYGLASPVHFEECPRLLCPLHGLETVEVGV